MTPFSLFLKQTKMVARARRRRRVETGLLMRQTIGTKELENTHTLQIKTVYILLKAEKDGGRLRERKRGDRND